MVSLQLMLWTKKPGEGFCDYMAVARVKTKAMVMKGHPVQLTAIRRKVAEWMKRPLRHHTVFGEVDNYMCPQQTRIRMHESILAAFGVRGMPSRDAWQVSPASSFAIRSVRWVRTVIWVGSPAVSGSCPVFMVKEGLAVGRGLCACFPKVAPALVKRAKDNLQRVADEAERAGAKSPSASDQRRR